MVKLDLKGIHRVVNKKTGKEYYYAWRGGPGLKGKPGSPAFVASFNEAISELKTPDADRFRSLVALYRGSNDYDGISDSTKKLWGPWLDKIGKHFGELRIEQFRRLDKIRPVIRRWRGQWAHQPRTADIGVQVLSRVFTYAIDPLGRLDINPCEGIKRLYKSDRSEIIWTDPQIAQVKAYTTEEVGWVIDLAAHTGLRLSDLLLSLSWSHIGEDAIEITTGKSKGKRTAIIPLYDGLRQVLARIPKRASIVLTHTRGMPWSVSGLQSAFERAKVGAKMKDLDLHFHDLRGTAATKFYTAGIPIRAIAEIMAWEEETVENIIRKYVGRAAATKALIIQINEARTKAVKSGVKSDGTNC